MSPAEFENALYMQMSVAMLGRDRKDVLRVMGALRAALKNFAVDAELFCPQCEARHIDKPGAAPHLSHVCSACKWVWRPSDFATNGVAEITTRGRDDS